MSAVMISIGWSLSYIFWYTKNFSTDCAIAKSYNDIETVH